MTNKKEKNSLVPENNATTRREFITHSAALSAGIAITVSSPSKKILDKVKLPATGHMVISLQVNGKAKSLEIDPRTTLLDALREKMHLTGTKKGCDRGQCGACTVLVNNTRVNSCLTLAAMCDGVKVTTIEGLGTPDKLHPVQQAFLKHDAFQCGYCTPGQICSAIGLIKEGHAKTDADIRELMSGNICRCGAYQNILDAVTEVQNA